MPSFYEASGWEASDWEEGNLQENRSTIRTSYALNNNSEVKRYNVSTSFSDGAYINSITENGFYPNNTLTKTIVKNENWKSADANNNTVEEFKDSRGNIVLKRNYNDGQAHDTYYVYNDLDLLAFVIPPMANGSVLGDHLEKWCYQYNYDAKKRLIEKKLPQKEWEYIVYDKADRVVMTGPVYNPFGDGAKGWLITKYDAFGRSVYTGYYAASTFSSAERNSLSLNNFTIESKLGSNTIIDGITTRYTNTSFPTNFKLLSVNYYDNYTYPNAPTAFPTIENQTVNTAVKGQLTGTWTRVLTTASSTAGNLSYSFYDDKYRVIRSYSQNHLGGYTQVDSQLTFTGVPSKTVTYQKQNSSATVLTITDVFTYDRRDRLTKQTEQIGTGSVETIVSNVYDALGVLITKNVGGTSGNLQKVDYKYNIRGWLTDINNAEMDFVDSENDLFQYKINYNKFAMQNVNLYNGNISSVWVRTKVDNSFKGYVYWYDHLNRLTQAKNMYYHKPGGWSIGQRMDDSYGEAATYDKNGNILTMNRTGELLDAQQAVAIDNLTYTYNGNQLQTVTDATNNTDGFKDGNTSGTDYFYDSFGNITQDLNKGITAVIYNHLSLPYQVTFANGSKINYTYDAAGTRLSKKVQPSGGALVTTDYVNGFQYTDNVLKFFPHTEGYVEFKNNQYLYTYQYKDHLGNIRLTYRDGFKFHPTEENPKDGIIQVAEIIEKSDYYPFGLKQKGNDLPDYSAVNKYKYGYVGKELNDELGLDLYDFGARNYDPALGRWLNVDPLAENSRRCTPYNYAYNNPIFFVDPDGMQAKKFEELKPVGDVNDLMVSNGYYETRIGDFAGAANFSGFYGTSGSDHVIIKGNKANEAFTDLQNSVASELKLEMNKNGKVIAKQLSKGQLSQGAADLLEATKDRDITVNVDASDDPYTSNKNAVGYRTGNFMGATYNADGTVATKQEVHPDLLNKFDAANNATIGQSMLHEVTESFKAGQIVKQEKFGVAYATQADLKNKNSVYYRAHNGVVRSGGDLLYIQPVSDSSGNLQQVNFYTGQNASVKFYEYNIK